LFNETEDEDDAVTMWPLLELLVVMVLAVVAGGVRSLVRLVLPVPPLLVLSRPITGATDSSV